MVEKHHAPVPRSEGLGELAGAGPRSSSAGGGRPGNGGSLVDLLCIFSEHRQNRSKTEAVDPDTVALPATKDSVLRTPPCRVRCSEPSW